MAEITQPEPARPPDGDIIFESHYQAKDNLKITFEHIQQMPDGPRKDEMIKLHTDLAKNPNETGISLANKRLHAALDRTDAEGLSKTAKENQPALPRYLAFATSIFKFVGGGALMGYVPGQQRSLQTIPNSITKSSLRQLHPAVVSLLTDDATHDMCKDAREILQRLKNTDSAASITGRDDVRQFVSHSRDVIPQVDEGSWNENVKRQFVSHSQDVIPPGDEGTTNSHDDEAAKWACVKLELKAHRVKGRIAILEAQAAAESLAVLENSLRAKVECEEERFRLETQRLIDEVAEDNIGKIREKLAAQHTYIQKKNAEKRRIVAHRHTLELIATKVQQELTVLHDMEAEAETQTENGALLRKAFEEVAATKKMATAFGFVRKEVREDKLSSKLSSRMSAIFESSGHTITAVAMQHLQNCNETCPLDACVFLRESPLFIPCATPSSPAVSDAGPKTPTRTPLKPFEEQKQDHGTSVESKQQRLRQIAAEKKEVEDRATNHPSEKGVLQGQREDETEQKSALATDDANRLESYGSDASAKKGTTKGAENEKDGHLGNDANEQCLANEHSLTNEWLVEDDKRIEEERKELEDKRQKTNQKKEAHLVERQQKTVDRNVSGHWSPLAKAEAEAAVIWKDAFEAQLAAEQALASLEKETMVNAVEEDLKRHRLAEKAKVIAAQQAREEKTRRIEERRDAKRVAIQEKKAQRKEIAAKKKAIQEILAREIEEQKSLKAKEDAEAKVRKAAAAKEALLAQARDLASSKRRRSPATKGSGKENDNGAFQEANNQREQELTPRTKRRRAEEARKREERLHNEKLEMGARHFEKRRQKEEKWEAERLALEKEKTRLVHTAAEKKAIEEIAAKQALETTEEAIREEEKRAAAMVKAVQALVAVRAAETAVEDPLEDQNNTTAVYKYSGTEVGSVEPFMPYVDTLHEQNVSHAAEAAIDDDAAEIIRKSIIGQIVANARLRNARQVKKEPSNPQGGVHREGPKFEETNAMTAQLFIQDRTENSVDDKKAMRNYADARTEMANNVRARSVALREARYALTIDKLSTKDKAAERERIARLAEELEALKTSYIVDFAKTKSTALATVSRNTRWDGVKKGVLQEWVNLTDAERTQGLSQGRAPHKLLARIERMTDKELHQYAQVFHSTEEAPNAPLRHKIDVSGSLAELSPEDVPNAPMQSDIEIYQPSAEVRDVELPIKLPDPQETQESPEALPTEQQIDSAPHQSVWDTKTNGRGAQISTPQERGTVVVRKKTRRSRHRRVTRKLEHRPLADITNDVDDQSLSANSKDDHGDTDSLRSLTELGDGARSRSRSLVDAQPIPADEANFLLGQIPDEASFTPARGAKRDDEEAKIGIPDACSDMVVRKKKARRGKRRRVSKQPNNALADAINRVDDVPPSRIPVPSTRKIANTPFTSFHAFIVLPKSVQKRVWTFAAYPEGPVFITDVLLEFISSAHQSGELDDPRLIPYMLRGGASPINHDLCTTQLTRTNFLQTCRTSRVAVLEAWKFDFMAKPYTFDGRGVPRRLVSNEAVALTQVLAGGKLLMIWYLNRLIGEVKARGRREQVALLAGGATLPLGEVWEDDRLRRQQTEEAEFAGRASPLEAPIGELLTSFMYDDSERMQQWMRDVR